MLYDLLDGRTFDLGHYSTINIDFNTVAWTGMDDDVVGLISSCTLMNKIPMLVDKEKINNMFYYRENVCAVTYIQK